MDFETQIKELCATAKGPYRRPFVPNTKWASANVFIIGTNPATPLRKEFASFDEYWNGLTARPEVFEKHYSAKHGGEASKTTKNIRKLVELLQPLNCLVTNVSWYPAKTKKEIPDAEWQLGKCALKTLISHCRPSVLFCHGQPAEEFAQWLGASVDRYALPETQEFVMNGMLILAFHHLSGMGIRGAPFDLPSALQHFTATIERHVRAL